MDLVRRFSESFGEEAGAHFTSRDIIYLMTDLLLSGADMSKQENITVYDMTMGTSQVLSCMEERIHDINPEMEVTCFGQEFTPSTFAIARADMMIRGGNPENMRFGDSKRRNRCASIHLKKRQKTSHLVDEKCNFVLTKLPYSSKLCVGNNRSSHSMSGSQKFLNRSITLWFHTRVCHSKARSVWDINAENRL